MLQNGSRRFCMNNGQLRLSLLYFLIKLEYHGRREDLCAVANYFIQNQVQILSQDASENESDIFILRLSLCTSQGSRICVLFQYFISLKYGVVAELVQEQLRGVNVTIPSLLYLALGGIICNSPFFMSRLLSSPYISSTPLAGILGVVQSGLCYPRL